MVTETIEYQHHCFCNQSRYKPRLECGSCIRLDKEYPEIDGKDNKDLIHHYFPGVLIIR